MLWGPPGLGRGQDFFAGRLGFAIHKLQNEQLGIGVAARAGVICLRDLPAPDGDQIILYGALSLETTLPQYQRWLLRTQPAFGINRTPRFDFALHKHDGESVDVMEMWVCRLLFMFKFHFGSKEHSMVFVQWYPWVLPSPSTHKGRRQQLTAQGYIGDGMFPLVWADDRPGGFDCCLAGSIVAPLHVVPAQYIPNGTLELFGEQRQVFAVNTTMLDMT
jgi:hypothetical protein